MRIKPRFAPLAATVALEPRLIERPGAMTSTLAPADWSDARVEAWLDWAESLPADLPANGQDDAALDEDHAAWLDGAADRWAHRLAAWGRAQVDLSVGRAVEQAMGATPGTEPVRPAVGGAVQEGGLVLIGRGGVLGQVGR